MPWDLPEPALEADVVLAGRYGADDLALIVFDLGKAVRHCPWTWPIPTARHLLAKRFVRTVEVVDFTPAIESALHGSEIGEAFEGEDLGDERPVEAFVLAAALRVIGTAVQDIDAEFEKPYPEAGPALPRRVAPWRAVVDEKGIGQAIAPEGLLQTALHRSALLVSARLQTNRKARVIVDHRQGVAERRVGKPDPALEVHLPETVRRLLLEVRW